MSAALVPLLKRCNSSNTDGYACYSLPVPVVVGITAGCIVFAFTVGVGIWFYCRLRKSRRRRREGEERGDDNKRVFNYSGGLAPEPIAFNPEAY